jgi:hypothetical protein
MRTRIYKKVSIGKHLGLVFAGWIVTLSAAAIFLPPLDSRPVHPAAAYRNLLITLCLLSAYTIMIVPAYLYQSWRRLPSVPNKLAYGCWVGFETVLLFVLPLAYGLSLLIR